MELPKKHAAHADPIMNETVKFYLDQVAQSSKRSRSILYLLLLSSALIFAYNWKTQKDNWLECRIKVRSNSAANQDSLKKLSPDDLKLSPNDLKTWQAMSWDSLNQADKDPHNHFYLWQEKAARAWLNWSQPYLTESATSNDNAKSKLEDLEKTANTWDQFTLPFTDITFDSNDFMLFSVLELLILAVVFVYCLLREEQNLAISFRHAAHVLPDFYEKASMEQIWNNPGAEHKVTAKILHAIPCLLFVIPVFVEWWAFKVDTDLNGNTEWWILPAHNGILGAWDILNRPLGQTVLDVEWGLMFLFTIAMVCAMRIFIRMNNRWNEAAATISRLPHPNPQ